MEILDLFSGIGGFSLGLERAGMKTVQFVEIDPFCQKVLRKHWPEVPIHDDIRSLTSHTISNGWREHQRVSQVNTENMGEYIKPSIEDCNSSNNAPKIDLICGGFPCQPFSCAGKRKGTEDDRFLWPEMLRVISEVHPTWVIAENVGGLYSQQDGMVFGQVLADLEAQGYEVQPFLIPACAVNAPHRRDRFWIVAKSYGSRKPQSGLQHTGIFAESDCHVADTKPEGLQGRTGKQMHTGRIPGKIRRGSSDEWSENWFEVATRLCRVDDGVSNRVDRLKALGNSIVPQIAEIIGRAIMEIEKK
jgi:DNA (cytosine-5)-methyltransferase 1